MTMPRAAAHSASGRALLLLLHSRQAGLSGNATCTEAFGLWGDRPIVPDAMPTHAITLGKRDPARDDTHKTIDAVTAKKSTKAKQPGLYANIHARQKRISEGSGEKMRQPGEDDAPSGKDFRKARKTARKKA